LGDGLEGTNLCTVDSEGVTVREVKVGTEPEAIRSALEGSADRLDRVGVEASSLGIWLYGELQPAGIPIIVVETRHMRVSLPTMRNKSDRNDAGHRTDDAIRFGTAPCMSNWCPGRRPSGLPNN
jgi:transposase